MSEPVFEIKVAGTHCGQAIQHVFQSSSWNFWQTKKVFSPLLGDLHRIAWVIYFLDRLFVRDKKVWKRSFRCTIGVFDPSFWTYHKNYDLLIHILSFLSGDNWDFEFVKRDSDTQHVMDFDFDELNTVFCLYSGGLDSMAGLVRQLQTYPNKSFVPVTVYHRPDIKVSTYRQLSAIAELYPNLQNKRRHTFPFRMEKNIKSFGDKRESTQRTRAFLFMAAGGTVALQCGGNQLEVYEAGIGAINAPLLPQMAGSLTTRSAHPEFLDKMGQLLSLIAQKDFKIILPFADMTKGELVSAMKGHPSLKELSRESFSCVNYPRRNTEKKICGKCFACIFRRIALFNAGIKENLDDYEFDILNKSDWNRMKPVDRRPLCCFLEQIDELSTSTKSNQLPDWIEDHIITTNASMGRPKEFIVNLYSKYSKECSRFIEKAAKMKCSWA